MSPADYHVLYASLLWGAVGSGYALYGRRQREGVPLVGGIVMIAVSYWAASALLMSIASMALILAIHVLLRRG